MIYFIFLFFFTLGVLMVAIGFWNMKIWRQIADFPTSTIRSAAMGPVEIRGKAHSKEPLISPVSGKECVFYRIISVAQKNESIIPKKIDEQQIPFSLTDDTGTVRINPQKANFVVYTAQTWISPKYHSTTFRRKGESSIDLTTAKEISPHAAILQKTSSIALLEYLITNDQEVYVNGHLTQDSEGPVVAKKNFMMISDKKEGMLNKTYKFSAYAFLILGTFVILICALMTILNVIIDNITGKIL